MSEAELMPASFGQALASAATPPQPLQEVTSILSVIERAARSPDVDIEKMERLFALQERMVAREAEIAFNGDLLAVQAELPRIKRTLWNDQTKSFYAGLESLNLAIIPVYTSHGFALSFGSADCPVEGHIRIICQVSHRGGHSRSYQCDVPLDLTGLKGNANKTGTHAFGSTMSYGRRYLTLMIFNLTLTNEDTDGNGEPDTIGPGQIADLEALLTEVGANRQMFLRFCKVESLEQIKVQHYQAAVAALVAKRKS